MTERTLELALLLPRETECRGCVDEVGDALRALEGVDAVEEDLRRGLLTVRFDEHVLAPAEIETLARRAGALAHCEEHCPLAVHDHGPLDLRRPLPGEDGHDRRVLHVTGMDCADCALKLQGALRREPGVRSADVNFGAATLTVAYDADGAGLEGVYRAVRRLGYDTVERQAAARPAAQAAGAAAAGVSRRGFWLRDRRALLTLVSGAFLAAGFAAGLVAPAASIWLFAAAIVAGGALVARAAFFSLRARQVDMNVLMTLAAIGAAAIGQWSEAGLVTFLFSLGTVLQAATLERTRRAITGLMELTPPECTVVRGGEEVTVAAAEVVPGDIVVVRPGERAAVDGVVTQGAAAADQAPVTGESQPVTKGPGDQVFAGSIIQGGGLRLRATAGAADNTIAKIVHLVEEAQAQRAPAQSIVDRFATRYTPVVVALAALVALAPPLFFGGAFDTWFYRGLALLIISCPCALVISTPVSILAALARATRDGVLIKGGACLEQAATLKAVAFDKTGTLTAGRPRVTDVVTLNGAAPLEVADLAARLEALSEHPLAQAIVDHYDNLVGDDGDAHDRDGGHDHDVCCDGDAHDHDDACCDGDSCGCGSARGHGHSGVSRFRAVAGKGVRAEVEGRPYSLGRPELLGPAAAADPALRQAIATLERQGKTTVVLGDERHALAVIAVSDPLREGADETVARLRELGVEQVSMLTGDNAETAAAIAAEAGIDDVHAGLLPAGKVDAVRKLSERHGAVAMVGDGVNDAPALAAAGLGIAMGAAGTDAALETADIALMGDDLGAVPDTIALARRARRIIWQNIVFSIAVKGVFLVLAPLGLVSLWLAVFADMGTSLLVTGNGLRLFHRPLMRLGR